MTDRRTTDTASGTNQPSPQPAPGKGRRLPRWRTLVIAGGAAAVLAAGAITYAVTRPVEPGFDNPEAIAALLAERGAPCRDFAGEGDGRADKRGACYVDGEKVIIATFGSRVEVEEHWERQLEQTADNETLGMVIGESWTISGAARAYLRHAATALKAEYRTN